MNENRSLKRRKKNRGLAQRSQHSAACDEHQMLSIANLAERPHLVTYKWLKPAQ